MTPAEAPATASAASAAPAEPALPALRADLRIVEGPRDRDGRAGIQIVDPLRNAHLRLAHPAAEAIRRWRAGDAATFREGLAREAGVALSAGQLAEIVEFLHHNELTVADRQNSWRGIAARRAAGRHGWATRLAHTYLFFRIPLIDPDRWLDRVAPRLGFVLTRRFAIGFAAMLAVAGWLILRQWDAFAASAAAAMTTEALPVYAALLFALKCVHELGHAVVAKHHGCRVPTMGIAVMLGAPVLYTDTTDTWRIDRRRRLAVVLAGVGAEMLVAGTALLAWSFLPEGAPRQMATALATLSVLTSVVLNLNPCMRFDGYFALSDLIDVPNLQERGFALTRAHLRRVLLGVAAPAAPDLTPVQARVLVVWGYLTWIYRAGLYVGIAALVYMMTFKVLGIVLFAFEVFWFLLRPLWLEGRTWWAMRGDLARSRRARLTAAAVGGAVVLAVLPWNRVVEAPAVRVAAEEAAVHAPMPARVVAVLVEDGASVEAGQVLVRLEAPTLAAQRRRTQAEIAALEARLARAPAMDSERESLPVLTSQRDAARETLAGFARLDGDLVIRAPIGGVVVDLDAGLGAGVWVSPGREIARIVAPGGVEVRALVEEADARRLRDGAAAVFVPETGIGPATAVRVRAIAESSERRIGEAALADVNGGPIATSDEHDGPAPRAALFAVSLTGGAAAPVLVERGTVRIAAAGESPVAGLVRRATQVLTRESGF